MMAMYKTTIEEDLHLTLCPFCKGTDLKITEITKPSPFKGCWYVHCDGCRADGPFENWCIHPGDAVKMWNRSI